MLDQKQLMGEYENENIGPTEIIHQIKFSYEQNIINRTHFMPLVSYPLKTSDNQRFSDVYWDYRKRPVKLIRLKRSIVP